MIIYRVEIDGDNNNNNIWIKQMPEKWMEPSYPENISCRFFRTVVSTHALYEHKATQSNCHIQKLTHKQKVGNFCDNLSVHVVHGFICMRSNQGRRRRLHPECKHHVCCAARVPAACQWNRIARSQKNRTGFSPTKTPVLYLSGHVRCQRYRQRGRWWGRQSKEKGTEKTETVNFIFYLCHTKS